MDNANQTIIDKFFGAFSRQDMSAIKEVMADNVKWYFLGNHPYAGVKEGIQEVVDFFNTMGKLMGKAAPTIEKPIVCENENHLIECVHTISNRGDGVELDHNACVLWTFENGRIIEGRHFFADPQAVDKYFTAIAKKEELQ